MIVLSNPGHKILATLGPSSSKPEVIAEMEAAGVSLFRINLSHTRLADLADVITTIRSATDVPICVDSEGAQIRTRKLVDGNLALSKDDLIDIRFDDEAGDRQGISLYPDGIATSLIPGDVIDIDFNGVRLIVESTSDASARARILQGGTIGENKGVSVNRRIHLPCLTEKDVAAIALSRQLDIQYFALSFSNRAEDVREFRAHIGDGAFLISKIESVEGLQNLGAITDEADAILIDRGDLSREVKLELIPFVQRRIIASARAHDKHVYVATNSLESMIEWHAPTRAEVNDVVSTLEMGANGLVLAAETAIGDHPVAAVKTIRNLLRLFDRWTPNTNIDELLSMNAK